MTGEATGDSTVGGEANASATPGEAEADARLSITTTGGEASGEQCYISYNRAPAFKK